MKKIIFIIIALLVMPGLQKHFSAETLNKRKVEKRFLERKEFAKNRADKLFGVFKKNLTQKESDLLKFLYAYMPLSDLADYNGEFFLNQVRTALKARDTFSWGKQVPEDIFRHFVLPYRINNENLDSARSVFFNELKDRIKNMSMKEAALEVNHWCHEKVNYEGSDGRTSAPLSTVKTSHGRCGEESTFTVTALRAVGIPARQVYTPRWASCDDNHAWVELWVDGKWSYLGACEPEADLNMGWFTERARRAMLVHTKVFGDYSGTDEALAKTDNYTEINVTANYADVKKIFVQVKDENGKSAKGAKVDFGLYNYAEFYPISSQMTDKKGLAGLTTGYGDLLVWASKDGRYAYEKISVGQTDTVKLKLSSQKGNVFSLDYNLIPPVEKTPYPVNQAQAEINNMRLKQEDMIRDKYRSTFIDSAASAQIAESKGLDKSAAWKFLKQSEGNWQEIKSFLENAKPEYKVYIFPLLSQISQKDLRDTKAGILINHLNNTLGYYKPGGQMSEDIFYEYVLNPRIKDEMLVAYRDILHNAFEKYSSSNPREAAGKVLNWIKDNVRLSAADNYYKVQITPSGVYSLRITDSQSRDIFFVAVCRSLGIASRLEPAFKTPQYYDGKEWLNAYFEKQSQPQPETGELVFDPIEVEKDNIIDPQYYRHFTLSKFEDGIYKTVDYDSEPKLSELPKKISLDTGFYRLITGNRREDGAVFARVSYFNIEKGKVASVPLSIRSYKQQSKVLGQISLYDEQQSNCLPVNLAELVKKDYLVIGWIEPGKEPTRHVIEELKSLKQNFEKWTGKLVLAIPSEKKTTAFEGDIIKGLPANSLLYDDTNDKILKQVRNVLGLENNISYPLFIVVNNNSQIVSFTQGYKIGTGEQLLKTVFLK